MKALQSKFTSLGYRFALYIFLVFLLIGILFSVVSMLASLDRQITRIEGYLNDILAESIPHITRDLWITDYSQVYHQLRLIQVFPYVERVEVHYIGSQIITVGDIQREHYRLRKYPLIYEYDEQNKELGVLTVFIDYKQMQEEILSAGILEFTLHLLLVIVLAAAVTVLFRFMLGRHLVYMTSFIQQNTDAEQWSPLCLERRTIFNDELSLLTEAFNSFQKEKSSILEQKTDLSVRMEELARDKETFLSIISHDLRSPVSGFKNLTSLLVQDFARLDTKELRTMLIELEKAGSRVYDLLENLLEWSALERGKLVPRKDRLPACLLLQNAFENMEHHARTKNITLNISCPEDCFIAGDERMTMVVLRNLISNAIKYTPVGGSVHGEISRVDSMVRFVVSDTGTGMEPETAAKLFDRRQKISSVGTEGEKGAGIGTVLAADFIALQQGKIWARSEPGNGTRVCFTLREWKNGEPASP